MNKQDKPLARLRTAIAAGFIGGAGLLLASPAMAQTDATVAPKEDQDNSSGLIHDTVDYLSDNTYVRYGPHYFDYIGSSDPLVVEDANGLAARAFGGGRSVLHNTGAGVGDRFFVGATIGVYIPGTQNHFAVEFLLAPPLELTFETRGRVVDESLAPKTQKGLKTGVPAIGRTVGTLKALPPNFTIVYRPWVDTMFQPYIGIGAMYLYTYDTDVTNDVLTANNNEPTLYLSKPVACVGQIGIDVQLPHDIFLNADVKYVGCAEITAKLNDVEIVAPKLSPSLGSVSVGTVSTTVDFEAVIYSLNVGVRF